MSTVVEGLFNVVVNAKDRKLEERRPQHWKLHVRPLDPKVAAYVRNDGEVSWQLSDLDVATIEKFNPQESMEMPNLRRLGMGWVWYVNDLSKYLLDAETLGEMTHQGVIFTGVMPDIPLEETALEPGDPPHADYRDPYVVDMLFPHTTFGQGIKNHGWICS